MKHWWGRRSYEIQDDDNHLEYVMMVARSRRRSTQLYVTESCIEERDNLPKEQVDEEEIEYYRP